MKHHLLFVLFCFSSIITFADGTLISWGGKDLEGMTQERFDAAKSWPAAYIIAKNITVDNWPETYLLAIASSKKQDSIIGMLIEQMGDLTQTKMKLTSRLIVWERIITKDILFEGKGFQVDDDIFSVAGRANWLLRNLTKKNFGIVTMRSTSQELAELQSKWKKWLNKESVEEYHSPYETEDKGLEEINSLAAFEAIIISLESTPEKETLIKNCLSRMYNLKELPKEKDSPANFCSPDTYSNMYLSRLSGIKEEHDYEWWKEWWKTNEKKLAWDSKKAKFEIKN